MTDPLPLVSVVTPSYNQGRFLKRTIDSVLNQTYPHIEYIVQDGRSRDESVAVLRSYGGRVAWASEPDRGQSHAINKGFARARGAVRAYLNSDDTLLPDAVRTAVAYFQRHPECDLVYGRARYIDEDDRDVGAYETADYSFERLARGCFICQPAAFWRARVADKVGPFNEALHYAMDYEYWLRVARAGGVLRHVPDVLAASRVHAATKTRTARERIFREMISVCKAQAGHAHLTFFTGLWHHLAHERRRGWPWRLRRLPKFFQVMAHLHYRWYNRSLGLAARP